MISSANALKFSLWLAANHPQAFQAVLDQVTPITTHRNRVALGSLHDGNLKRGIYIPRREAAMRAASSRARFGRLGRLGDVLEEFAPTVEPMTSFSDPVLQDINIDMPDLSSSFDWGSLSTGADTSGGFWSSLGSGLSSIGGGLMSAVGSVASAITNPNVLKAAGTVAATVIAANSSQRQAQQQQSILAAQMQRVSTGSAPAPVRYYTDPQSGQSVPYYYNAATGQYQPTQATALLGSSFSQYLPYLLIGGGVIVLALILKR